MPQGDNCVPHAVKVNDILEVCSGTRTDVECSEATVGITVTLLQDRTTCSKTAAKLNDMIYKFTMGDVLGTFSCTPSGYLKDDAKCSTSVALLNTAIEKLADRLTLDHDKQIGRVKDMGSAAVGVALLMAGAFWIIALLERLGFL